MQNTGASGRWHGCARRWMSPARASMPGATASPAPAPKRTRCWLRRLTEVSRAATAPMVPLVSARCSGRGSFLRPAPHRTAHASERPAWPAEASWIAEGHRQASRGGGQSPRSGLRGVGCEPEVDPRLRWSGPGDGGSQAFAEFHGSKVSVNVPLAARSMKRRAPGLSVPEPHSQRRRPP